jgi:uncharacterized membrane protein YbhN (UPF0104 family)
MKRRLLPALQFAVGVCLISALLWRIHHGRSVVEFAPSADARLAPGAVFVAAARTNVLVQVTRLRADSASLVLACPRGPREAAALCGELVPLGDAAAAHLRLDGLRARPAGLNEFGRTLAGARHRLGLVFVSLVGMSLTILFCSLRWHILLAAQGIRLGLRRATELNLVGVFFSMLLPGATSGDFLKAWYVARDTPGRRAESATTVFLDRVVGLLGLILLAGVVLAWPFHGFAQDGLFRKVLVSTGVFALLVGGGLVGAIWFPISLRGRWGETLTRIRSSLRSGLANPATLAWVTALSIGNHLAFLASEYAAATALGAHLTVGQALCGFLIVNVVAAIPVTPGGLGSREAACVLVLGRFGIPPETALATSLLVYAWLLLIGLSGAVVWAFLRRQAELPDAAAMGSDATAPDRPNQPAGS